MNKEEREFQEALEQAQQMLGGEIVKPSSVNPHEMISKGRRSNIGETDLSDVEFVLTGDYPPALAPGGYVCTLRQIEKGMKKKWQSEELEPALIFKWQEKKSERLIFETLKVSMHERSKLRSRIQAMSGMVLKDDNLTQRGLKELLESFVSKDYLLQLSRSADGKWNNVQHVMLLPDMD